MDKLLARVTAFGAAIAGLGTVVIVTGGAIAWIRYSIADLPADQAVAVMAETELVTLGAVSLIGFAVAGALSVLIVYLIDHCGRPVPKSRIGLAAILAAGIWAAIWVRWERPDDPDADWNAPWFEGGVLLLVLVAFVGLTLFLQDREKKDKDGVPIPELPHVAILVVLYGVFCFVLGWRIDEWIGVAAAIGGVLAGAALWISWSTGSTFRWYGVAVFIAVLSYGAAVTMLHAAYQPKVQAAAVLFTAEVGGGGLSGVHVAETDDRIYLAVVERRCYRDPKTQRLVVTDYARARSGRVVEIPRDRVVSVAVGPLQDIEDADNRGKQMLNDLETRVARSATSPIPAIDPCAAQGVLDLSERDSTPVEPKVAFELAKRHRPVIRFDSRERWRPLNVDRFFGERPRHRLCESAGGCSDLGSVRTLEAAAGRGGYIDLAGRRRDGSQHRTPRACPLPSPLKDCDAGGNSAIYFNATEANGRIYIDYWWFLRFNKFDLFNDATRELCRVSQCFDHEGDWEGVTVVTAPGDPDSLQYVGLASHEGVFRFTADELERDEDRRPVIYVANGSHAAYPAKCDNCWQPAGLPEARTNGRAEWGRNDDVECFAGEPCLLPLPAAQGESWNAYRGRWGSCERRGGSCVLGNGPKTPAAQRRFQRPWCFTAGDRESCDAEVPSDAGSAAQPGVADATDCDAWLSGLIVAAACDPEQLAATLSTDEVPDAEALAVGVAGRGTGSGTRVRGVAQVVGTPLAVGGSATVKGKLSKEARFVVRYVSGGQRRQATFTDLGLEEGGTATAKIERRNGRVVATLTRPDEEKREGSLAPV